MIYYYFTLAFVILASFAVCGLSATYTPELIFKKRITVKNETVRKLLKIEAEDEKGKSNDEYRECVTVLGIVLKLLWVVFTAASFVVLFGLGEIPITEEHKTALVMPSLLTSFNQKLAHYINLVFLLFSSGVCIFNCSKILCKPEDGTKIKAVIAIRIIWCLVAVVFLCFGVYIMVKCIQLFSFF